MKQVKSCYQNMFLALASCLFFFACVPQRKIVYFQDKEHDEKDTMKLIVPVRLDMMVYPKDFLSIIVYTDNPEALPGVGTSIDIKQVDNRPPYERSFTIDDKGNVTLPLVGVIPVAGLTIEKAREAITNKYKVYVSNPVVVVKKLSFKISILGEVGQPGIYYIPNESINILEAMSLASDLTKYGSRTDVKLIRTINGKQEEFYIDLTDKRALYSPYFFLMQDDVIYVRPLKAKRWADISPQVSIITSIVSVTVGVFTLLIVTSNK